MIWCPPFLYGANVWSCCGGLPPREYLGQKLALWFGNAHHRHLQVVCWLSKIPVETRGAGGRLQHCPRPRELRCLFDPDCRHLPPPVMSADLQMDGR